MGKTWIFLAYLVVTASLWMNVKKHCPRYSSCGTIAGANDILVKYEDERYSCETNPFFFTFGSSNTFPYQNGYVKVIGESRDDAVAKFRKIYPDINENTVNCAFIYTQEEWLELLVNIIH